MAIIWPAGLPQLPLIGWSEDLGKTTARFQTDAGPAQVRQRFTAGVRQLTMPLALTETQMDTLDTFYTTTTSGGALAFDWQHPRTGATESFRFLAPPNATEVTHGLYRLSLSLELLP